jgi:hypothetical protein
LPGPAAKHGTYATTLAATTPAGEGIADRHLALVDAHLTRLSDHIGRHQPRLADVKHVETMLNLIDRVNGLEQAVGIISRGRFKRTMNAIVGAIIRNVPEQARRERIAAEMRQIGPAMDCESLPAIELPPPALTPDAIAGAIGTDEQACRVATDALVGRAAHDAVYRRDVLMRLAAHEAATADMVAIVTGRSFSDDGEDMDLEISATGEIVNHRAGERVESEP